MNERDSEWSQVSHSSSTPNFIPNTHTQMTSDHQNCVELSRGSSPIGSGSGRGLALVGKGGGGWEHTATVTHFVNTQLHSRGWWQHSSRQATTSGFPWRSHPGYYRSITRQDLYSSELSTFLLLPSPEVVTSSATTLNFEPPPSPRGRSVKPGRRFDAERKNYNLPSVLSQL